MKIYNNKSLKATLKGLDGPATRFTAFLFAIIGAFVFSLPAIAQEMTVDNAVISIPSGAVISSEGGVTIQNSGGIYNNGNVELKGGWTNNASGLINGGNGTVMLNGSNSQVIGGTFSTEFYNLDISNTGGVSLLQSASVEDQLTLNNHLMLNSNNLVLGANAPAVAGMLGASDGMVVCNGSGMMRKLFSNNGTYFYPLGDIDVVSEYSPLMLNFTSGSFATGAYAEVSVVNAKHPHNGSTTNWLNRYWNINSSNINSFNCNVSGDYLAADVVGTETSIIGAQYYDALSVSATPWQKYQVFTNAHTLLANNVTRLSSFTGIEEITSPLPDFSVYPNPAHENMMVSIDAKEATGFTIQLLDFSGRIVFSENVTATPGLNKYDLNLIHLPKGIYMLEAKSSENDVPITPGKWKIKVAVI